MGYSKRQFIDAALEEIGLGRYTFDVQPEQEQSALRLLDSMMAEWYASGIALAYPLPGSPESSDLDAQTNVPDAAYEAIRCNLALKLAPSYGRNPMPGTATSAVKALNALRVAFTEIPQMQPSRLTLLGAGNRRWPLGRVFAQRSPRVDVGSNGYIEAQ